MSCNILIIEDNQTNMELMVYLLGAFGYEVSTAPDGREGIDIALGQGPDLILCDLEMPRMNGYEVATHLRAQSTLPPIPIIAVTALAMVGDRDKVLASGFDGYISKPIYPETFVDQVEVFIPHHKRPPRAKLSSEVVPARAHDLKSTRAVVLLVDDSPINVELVCSVLEPTGYTVISANTVAVAMELARHKSIDLILSDLHMSPESGLAFLEHVKADARLKPIPFILLTASMTDPRGGEEEKALQLGVARFLSRPIAPEQLLLEVEACLTNNRASNR
ncbi:MAG: response regulator [Terracidiphilus sp.]|jgi:two-component system cell cycle response regulator